MADPTAQDAQLVQQCLVRLLLAVRGLAEARARALTDAGPRAPARPSDGRCRPTDKGEDRWRRIPDVFKDLLQKKAFAKLATVNADGTPQVTPVWFDFDGTHVRFNTAGPA